MIDGYINISEAAEKWGISTRRVQVLCKNGRIEGAAKLGREWVIPATAEKPGDDRFVNGKYVAWRKKSPKIRETNTGIKSNQDKLDKWDYAISISSGAITAAMDILWVKDINLFDARTWGKEKVEDFVMAVAKNQKGYSGKNLKDAIKFLEDKYPIAADDFTNDFGGGKQHHLRDFAHHPTIVGLVFSIMTQFTKYGYGTDVDGNFIPVEIAKTDHIGNSFADKIYMGAVSWIFHMVSDMAGSSSSAANQSDGTGIPGPIMSLLKELSAIPGIKHIAGKDDKGHNQFSVECSKLFNGTLLGKHDENGKIIKDEVLKFDLRTEIGIANEAIFHYDNMSEIYIGSSNISRSALTSGIEWNYRFNNNQDSQNFNLFYETFEDLFKNHSYVINDAELKEYSKNWHKPAVAKDLARYDQVDPDTKVEMLFQPTCRWADACKTL